MAKRTRTRKRVANDNGAEAVSPFAEQHGDYRTATVVDLTGELGGQRQSMVKVMRNVAPSTVDRWLHEGGPGFDEPQKRAIDHIRGLWAILGEGPRLIANYTGVGGGQGDREGYVAALHSIGAYEREFPPYIWSAFENVVRWDEPAGTAGSKLAKHVPQQIAAAKACVGFVASKIAEWRGY